MMRSSRGKILDRQNRMRRPAPTRAPPAVTVIVSPDEVASGTRACEKPIAKPTPACGRSVYMMSAAALNPSRPVDAWLVTAVDDAGRTQTFGTARVTLSPPQ